MRLYSDHPGTYEAGGPTEPMEAVPGPLPGGTPPAPHRPRLPLLQSMYYVVAIAVLLAGSLGTLAMHFGWFDPLLQGTGQQSPATHALFTPTPAQHPSLPGVLAQDTFARPDQLLWGTATNGSPWQADANRSPAFAIAGHTGTITGGRGFFDALLGPLVSNEEAQTTASITRFNGGRDNFGVVVRFSDANDYYKTYLDGASLVLIKRVAGHTSALSSVPFAAQDGRSYSLRFRAVGQQLFVRAWPSAGPEPGGWMITASDGSLTSGFGGLRALLENDIAITVTAFGELAVSGQSHS